MNLIILFVYLAALLVGPSKYISHCAGVVEDMQPAWSNDDAQIQTYHSRLRRFEVDPAPIQAGVALAHVADLQRSRAELRVKAHSVLTQELLIDPVEYWHWTTGLVNSGIDGQGAEGGEVFLVPEEKSDSASRVVNADVARQKRCLPVLIYYLLDLGGKKNENVLL